MHENNFVLSPCGISIFNNLSDNESRKILFKNANKKKSEEINKNDLEILRNLIEKTRNAFKVANMDDVVKYSAELNGIIRFYNSNINDNNDIHELVCSDTWLGEEAAEIIKDWMSKFYSNYTVFVRRTPDLQTEDLASFQASLSNFIRKHSPIFTEYKKSGHKIIFNLTGGFKSLQGFLQSIANFYADETIYIFEGSESLLRIPRLPIKLDAETMILDNLSTFRKLNIGMKVTQEDIRDISETMLLIIDDMISLSAWGDILWDQTIKSIYSRELYPPVSHLIKISDKFRQSITKIAPDRLVDINMKIDDLSDYLENRQNGCLASLDFKKLKGKSQLPSTHELDAWSDGDAKRIYGHFENEIFILDKLAKALH